MADQARWWEHYYVRYFVGTAFAVPLLLMIGQHEPWNTAFTGFSGQAWLTAGAVAVGGLAFCYIASAPILLLHTMRARIPRTQATYRWVVGVIGAIAIAAVIALWCVDRKAQDPSESALLLLPYTLVVVAQVLLFLYGIWRKGAQSSAAPSQPSSTTASHIEQVASFYAAVAAKRAEAFKRPEDTRTARAEYMESYRHLREHGNAVLILVAEAILALALLYASSFITALLVIVLWVLPATIVWPMATWLEASMDSASVA